MVVTDLVRVLIHDRRGICKEENEIQIVEGTHDRNHRTLSFRVRAG